MDCTLKITGNLGRIPWRLSIRLRKKERAIKYSEVARNYIYLPSAIFICFLEEEKRKENT